MTPGGQLAIRRKTPKRKRSCRYRGERTEPVARNDTWAMDFMSDRLFDNRAYRILTILDCHSRESLATEPRQSFRAANVVDVLDRLIREHGKPKTIRCDNGPEFAGRVLDQWAFYNRIELDFSRPATPTDNAYIESFNARLRQELLNASWFALLAEASAGLEAWKRGQTAHGATEPDTQRVHRGSASGLKSRSPQTLSETFSFDGGDTFIGPEQIAVDYVGGTRPGMGTTVQLPNGSWRMAYELCGATPACQVRIRASDDGIRWNGADDAVFALELVGGIQHWSYLAHAPVLSWSAQGGPQGTLIVSGQVEHNGDDTIAPGNGRTLFINTSGGEGYWTPAAAPVPVAIPYDDRPLCPDKNAAGTGCGPYNSCANYSSQVLALGPSIIELAAQGDGSGCFVYSGISDLYPAPLLSACELQQDVEVPQCIPTCHTLDGLCFVDGSHPLCRSYRIVVSALDSTGSPVRGATVTFGVVDGPGTNFETGTAITDFLGRAAWNLNIRAYRINSDPIPQNTTSRVRAVWLILTTSPEAPKSISCGLPIFFVRMPYRSTT
jgi:hypothetical protein